METCFGVRKGAWTEEEDNLLRKCVEKYGEAKWHQVPERAGLNRCRKSCRLRWLNYLKPDIKRGEFRADEVDLILRLNKLLGNRWSLIAGRLAGRTANDVKNYWNTHLHKKVDSFCNKKCESKSAHDKTEKINIIKPRPQTFSKNSPWLSAISSNLNNEQSANHNLCRLSTPFDRHQQENIETKWWDSLSAEKEFDYEISSPMGWQGRGAIADLLDEKSPTGSGTKLEDIFAEAGQNRATATDDFSIDLELWDTLNTGQ